jgi:hypothetical protein
MLSLTVAVGIAAAAAAASSAPGTGVGIELQGSTVASTGGGSVWVLTSSDIINATALRNVHVVDVASKRTVATASIEGAAPDGGLLLVGVPSGLAPAVHHLIFDPADGAAVSSPPINAPAPHWTTPRGRTNDELAVYGRRFRRVAGTKVTLAGASRAEVAAHVENENRATFVVPASLQPGRYEVTYEDALGVWPSNLPMAVDVVAPWPVAKVVNASLAPYFADPSGTKNAVPAILAALAAAGSGGTVSLGSGVFLLDRNTSTLQDRDCISMAAAVCRVPTAPGSLPSLLRGLGPGATVLRAGATVQNSFWGSAVSLQDLTLTDKLPDGQQPSVPTGSYNSPALWSMDTYGAWAHNMTDLAFRNVHFVSSRNHSHALLLRYTRTVKIINCRFDYASIMLSGPLLDVQLINVSARLQSQSSTGFLQNGVGGRVSSVVIANTSVTGLVPQAQSTIAGRFHQAQGYWEHLYVAGNVNERASPGDLHHDMNQGEQFCWESGKSEQDAHVRIAAAPSIVQPEAGGTGSREHSEQTGEDPAGVVMGAPWPTLELAQALPQVTADALTQMLSEGLGEGQTWSKRYGLGTGGVSVIKGRGAGQVRRLVGMASDNRTLQLERAFSVQPDSESLLAVFMTMVFSATIRDNVFVGARAQVSQPDHTAACMIPLWGRADTVDFINNTGHSIRGTMYVQVSPNLTVTDHIIRDTVSTNTRYGMRLQNEPRDGQLSMILSIQNYTVAGAVENGHKAMATCRKPRPDGDIGSTCTGARMAGGVVISGLSIRNASTAFLMEKNNNGRAPPGSAGPPPVVDSSFEGTGLAVYALRGFSFEGSGVGAQIEGGTIGVGETFAHGRIEECGVGLNCSVGVDCDGFRKSLEPPPPP